MKDIRDKLKKDRLGKSNGYEVELEKILGDKAKMYEQAYHGGALDGVCCIQLLENQAEIIDVVREMCEERR